MLQNIIIYKLSTMRRK